MGRSTAVEWPPHEEQFSTKVLFWGPKVHRMHHGTPQKYRNRPTRANYALWNVAWSPRVLDIWEKRSKTADSDRRPWGTISKRFQTLGNATINRYFEVGTIIRINRLKPVNCSTEFITVSLTKFASRSFSVKVKNPEAEKLDGNRYRIKFPIDYRRVFLIAVFFRGALLPANSRYRPPPYSFACGGNRSRHFWGLAGVRFLFYLNLYEDIYMFTFKKKHTSEPPARSETRFGILIEFRSRTDL